MAEARLAERQQAAAQMFGRGDEQDAALGGGDAAHAGDFERLLARVAAVRFDAQPAPRDAAQHHLRLHASRCGTLHISIGGQRDDHAGVGVVVRGLRAVVGAHEARRAGDAAAAEHDDDLGFQPRRLGSVASQR